MSEDAVYGLPEEIASLIPPVENEPPSTTHAQQAVDEMKEDFNNRAEKMLEAAQNLPEAKIALNGIFRHPPEFTKEEWEIIIAGLRAHLPLYAISMKVHCERHFLARKIQENKEVAQLIMDSREGIIDETEFQLYKAARSGSMTAIIYLLDHMGQGRGYGEQGGAKDPQDDVHITFGEISEKDLQAAQQQIAEAQKIITPTLAGELAQVEVPQKATAQDRAFAEDLAKSIENANKPKSEEIRTPDHVSPPPYNQNNTIDSRYDYLESVFDEGAQSPFNAF